MRPVPSLPACMLLLLLTLQPPAPSLGLNRGNGFRWFWRGSAGGSAGGSSTRKFSYQGRGGSTSGGHSMLVVRVKDSSGRTVLLDPANAQISRSVVHGFPGKAGSKSAFTVSKAHVIGSPAFDATVAKPSKYLQPPPAPVNTVGTAAVKKLAPAAWIVPPAAEVASTERPTHGYLPPPSAPASKAPLQAAQPQVSSKLILGPQPGSTSGPSSGPVAPGERSALRGLLQPPAQRIVDITGPSSPSGPDPTPTPATHVGRDIRRNLSGRVDGSVFFGILPVVNDLQRTQEVKTEPPPPQVVISRRPGKCPYVNMSRCPAALAGGRQTGCSNDSQCGRGRRCCYNPCVANSRCMRAVQ